MTDEPRTPEGRLIREYADRSGLSARRVAAKIGISDTQYRHWVRGTDGRGGPVTFPAIGLVNAAKALGVIPAQLREVGREDAADLMENGPAIAAEAERIFGRPASETVVPGDQDVPILFDMPRQVVAGLSPADLEEVITAAKLRALQTAREIRRRLDE